MDGYIYLASPYSHPRPDVREMRYLKVRDIAAKLIMEVGQPCYSPIVHGHDMAISSNLHHGYETWRAQDEAMIKSARELWVVMLPGWIESYGIEEEIKVAMRELVPVRYMEPGNLTLFDKPPVVVN